MKLFFTLFTLILLHFSWFFTLVPQHYPYQALTISPVVDLVGHAFGPFVSPKNVKEYYSILPYCGQNPTIPGQRLHQILFNETVTIHEEKGDEVRITIPNAFYSIGQEKKPLNTYWALKKNFISLDRLKKKQVNLNLIPKPLSFEQKNRDCSPIITLTMPYHNKSLNITFSAGTRFVKAEDNGQKDFWSVYAFNKKTETVCTLLVPKKISLSSQLPHSDPKKQFIAVLKKWANLPYGSIAYVWGGSSFIKPCIKEIPFSTHEKKTSNGDLYTWYERPTSPDTAHAGMDCAGMVLRAAQICGIPYFFKNTFTLEQNLRSLGINDYVEEGDLIWFPGHVMVISDHNHLIEARAYAHGYGIVHELPISKIFSTISTVQELVQAYFLRTPLERLNNKGIIVQKIPVFKILKLEGVAP